MILRGLLRPKNNTMNIEQASILKQLIDKLLTGRKFVTVLQVGNGKLDIEANCKLREAYIVEYSKGKAGVSMSYSINNGINGRTKTGLNNVILDVNERSITSKEKNGYGEPVTFKIQMLDEKRNDWKVWREMSKQWDAVQ